MTVACYVRVSTEEQAAQGFSLEAQKARLISFCESQGWTDYEVFTDDGYSGTTMQRPALRKLIRATQRGDIHAVLVYRIDRLSRKLRDVLYLLEDVFDANGIVFKSATEPFDTSTPLGRAMLGILAVFAQLERDTIIERTKIGLKQRAQTGLWAGGTFPFGYRMNPDTGVLEVVPEEAELVSEAYARFLAGESRASIGRWLAERVTNRDVNTLFVRRLFARQTYVGRLVLNGEVFEGQHEPIIDLETFERVQAKLAGIVIPRGGQRHLLSGLMTCGVCGSGMHYWAVKQKRPNGKEYRYMRVICTKKRVDNSCKSKSILAREIESTVVSKMLSTPLDIDLHFTPDKSDDDFTPSLQSKLQDLDDQRKRLVDAVQRGILPFDVVKENFEALEKKRKAIQTQLDDLTPDMTRANAEAFIQTLKQAQEVWDDLDQESQRTMLRTLIKRVHIYPDKMVDIEFAL